MTDKPVHHREKTVENYNSVRPMTLEESTDIIRDLEDEVATLKNLNKNCDHLPGKFLGQCLSHNWERYECARCKQELVVEIRKY